MIGELAEVELDPEADINPGCNNRATKGVAPQIEKIVISIDICQIKTLCPDIRQQYLRFCLGPITVVAIAVRKRKLPERLPIDFVTFVVGELIQKHDS